MSSITEDATTWDQTFSSYRRPFAYGVTLVTVVFLSLLLTTRTLSPDITLITRMPNSDNTLVTGAIRGDHSRTLPTGMNPTSSPQGVGHPTVNSTSPGGEKNISYLLAAKNMRKPKSYYMGLSCPKRKAKPGANLPKTTLASYPRAGNGWTRDLIQYATGLYVGSEGWIGKTKHINMGDFPATGEDIEENRVVIIKTHDMPRPSTAREVVLLIRNPYRAIVSQVYHTIFERKNFSKKKMLSFFKTDKWVEEVTRMSMAWTTHATRWINQSERLLVVSNERLFDNTEGEVARILEFLHQPIKEKQLQCAVKFFYPRPSSIKFKMDPYTDELRTLIDSRIEVVNRTLSERRQPTLPTYANIPIF